MNKNINKFACDEYSNLSDLISSEIDYNENLSDKNKNNVKNNININNINNKEINIKPLIDYTNDFEKDNTSNNNEENDELSGIPNREYFVNIINNNNVSNIYSKDYFKFQEVNVDGNCGYRAIALQIYGNENNYYIIRKNVYEYLNINKKHYSNLNF